MWVSSQLSYDFSDFLNKLVSFHDNQWKPKYHPAFLDLAEVNDAVLSLIAANERPKDADVKFASLSGCIKTLLKTGITDKKNGAEAQQDFMQQYNQVSEAWTKFAANFSRFHADCVANDTKTQNVDSLPSHFIQDTPDTIAAKILRLRQVVESRNVETCGSWHQRAWKDHPKKMVGATALFGTAIVAEGVNAFNTYAAPVVDQFLEAHSPIAGVRHQHLVLGFSLLTGLMSAGLFARSLNQSRRQPMPLQEVKVVELDELSPNLDTDDERHSLLNRAS